MSEINFAEGVVVFVHSERCPLSEEWIPLIRSTASDRGGPSRRPVTEINIIREAEILQALDCIVTISVADTPPCHAKRLQMHLDYLLFRVQYAELMINGLGCT